MAFGRAYGTLPENAADVSRDEQESFWINRLPGLAEDGKIISVRLALFAEMVKGEALDSGHAQGSRRHGGSRR